MTNLKSAVELWTANFTDIFVYLCKKKLCFQNNVLFVHTSIIYYHNQEKYYFVHELMSLNISTYLLFLTI